MKPTILIVDDEKPAREGLRAALDSRYDVYLAEDAKSAFELLESEKFDVLLSDLRLPGEDGMQLIRRAKTLSHPPVCILMTAYGSEDLAVEAMKQGADDYISKGRLQLDELEIRIARFIKSQTLETENRQLHQQLDDRFGLHTIIGESSAIRNLMETIKQVAPTHATILLEGESGTGKELAAQSIHHLSSRSKGPLVAVHCAALSSQLLESELFGHEKGSFTGAFEKKLGRFELANNGTLFLDEISEIDTSTQVKILRVLEAREFERVGGTKTIHTDIRLIAATNRDLRKMVAEGKFREDLFFRLNIIKIKLPPLRERIEDISLLSEHFLKRFNRENEKKIKGFSPDVLQAFNRYPWSGNIRELRNVINRMVIMAHSDRLTLKDLPEEFRDSLSQHLQTHLPETLNLVENEKRFIEKALQQTQNNITQAARLLGISRRTLHRKLKEYKLTSFKS